MKVFGVVAEFNPFHNGHAKLISNAKAGGCSHCVAVMSGNYVQRAEPAITDKWTRARAALLNGVDLVIELPLPYATATAQSFALGSVSLLKATGVVDTICFGSELGSAKKLSEISSMLESPLLESPLKGYLSEGYTFAKARQLALNEVFGTPNAEIIASPNNILGLEYISAAKKLNWEVSFLTFPRVGTAHDSKITNENYASASFLREQGNMLALGKYVPAKALDVYEAAYQMGKFPADKSKLDIAMLACLRRKTVADFLSLPDISEGIENRLYNAVQRSNSIAELYSNIKTKRYTLSRVRRLVLAAFLGIEKSDFDNLPQYIRVLGFNKKGEELLGSMKKQATLPVHTSLKELKKLDKACERFANLEAVSTDIYGLTLPSPVACGAEYSSSSVFAK